MKGLPALAPSLACALSGALALAPVLARAEPSGNADKTIAESLDAEGTALLDERRYDEACDRFAESYRLFPGNGVLLRLGLCQELQGKTASAWLTFRDAAVRARASGDTQIERLATRRAAAIEPRLSRLIVRLDPEAEAVSQVRVTRDKISLGRAAFGSALPIDPGEHTIEASAPSGQKFTQTVVVGNGGGSETVVVTFTDARTGQVAGVGDGAAATPAGQAAEGQGAPADLAASAPPSQGPASAPASVTLARTKAAPTPEGAATPSWSAQKTAAVAVGGFGLAGLGAGVAFQLAVYAKRDRAESLCPTRRDCSSETIEARDEGKSHARFAAAAFAAGAAGVAGGLVLWLTAPNASPARAGAPRVSPVFAAGQVGVHMEGTW